MKVLVTGAGGMLGHDVPRIYSLVFGLGCGMAGLAGVIAGNTFNTAPDMAALPPGEVGEVLYRPVVSGVVSVGVAWAIAIWMDQHGVWELWQLIETVAVATALNLLMARVWMRPVWDDLWMRMGRLLPRRAMA